MTDADILAEQAKTIDACLDRYIPADRPVALLQFPHDLNVGNHMMWIAAVEYLRQRRAPIAYAAYGYNFDLNVMKRAVQDGTIIFLGGVTISRLWPRHAQVKRIVAAGCKDNRLVSLPSTVLFLDDEDRREAATMFGNHPDVVLLTRDPVSAVSARDVFPSSVRIETVHDSALRLPRQRRTQPPAQDIIWLARDDKEAAGAELPEGVTPFDWPHTAARAQRVFFPSRVWSRMRKWNSVLEPPTNRLITACYESYSRYVMRMGNKALDAGKVLVTDRLHPHILAALRSQPVVLLPDRYGKNRAVYDYTSHVYKTVHWAQTPDEALATARALVANTT